MASNLEFSIIPMYLKHDELKISFNKGRDSGLKLVAKHSEYGGSLNCSSHLFFVMVIVK